MSKLDEQGPSTRVRKRYYKRNRTSTPALVEIVQHVLDYDVPLGDKAITRLMAEMCDDGFRSRFGAPPSPRSVRRLAARLRGGLLPYRDHGMIRLRHVGTVAGRHEVYAASGGRFGEGPTLVRVDAPGAGA